MNPNDLLKAAAPFALNPKVDKFFKNLSWVFSSYDNFIMMDVKTAELMRDVPYWARLVLFCMVEDAKKA